ncbi:MAG: hypothetical protein PHE68_05280 [Candidatus Peribacteraceae bacterium]|nr:hypothetical protein [Candidatus Peribacteraceae bacterium]MDD5074689.1 hypothetical protein [Candidatus Peribacteraceae bacterium]
MHYFSEDDVLAIATPWKSVLHAIEEATRAMARKDFVQPLKPYLRFGDVCNRIIAMPAYVGGSIAVAGIKWIASFPQNIERGIPRAHAVCILNNPETGVPETIFNSGSLSAIRTAGVSGVILRHFLMHRPKRNLTVGIIGWGPIGRMHYNMIGAAFAQNTSSILLFDTKGIEKKSVPDIPGIENHICDSWLEVYEKADVFITCTVAHERYIDRKPRPGSLLLNVSLRDFQPEMFLYTKAIIVDDWTEVCRENTDIQQMHQKYGLQESDTRSICDVVVNDHMALVHEEEAVFFNPMGMAVFDMAVAQQLAQDLSAANRGHFLP